MEIDNDGPSYRVSTYTVYPSGFDRVAVPERKQWCVAVVDAGDGWAIRWRSRCLDYRGNWQFEPPVKGRTTEFLRRCRFSEHAALHRARQIVDDLIVNGQTYDEFVEHVRAEAAERARLVLERGHGVPPGVNAPGAASLPLRSRVMRRRVSLQTI
jgi:hypothetical protein